MAHTQTEPQRSSPRSPGAGLLAGRYRLHEQLGVGGMGVVFRARDEVLGRDVALKQLQLSAAHSGNRKLIEALFEREYHTLVRLKHPRIVEAYEYGLDPQGPYYTMELLAGRDLKELAPLPYREACQHIRDVASALALLHAHGLLHRDVSPRNVRLGPDGRAKLIDFGALAPFGTPTSVVGTPICIPPEAVRRMPLDQRADLYALGAIAYLALTGEAPFPARRIEDLERNWQTPPRPPSQRATDVPPELDALVLSLLSIDPLARPSSAAAVIDQLTAIADLVPEETEQTADSYLLSGALVGREQEQEWLHKRMARALDGHGAQVVVAGSAGIGKTRLLHELSLVAQLKGMVALKADAQATADAFGVATRLGVELLSACPEQARRAARPHAGLLAQLSNALRERLGDPAPVALAGDPGERRARFQAALHDWFVQVSKEQALWIAVDNVQAADSNSAAFLAALGRACDENRMLLLSTQRSGEDGVAPEALRALRSQASQLKLGALGRPDCESMVRSLFGDVPNTGRVAKLLHDRSGGNPQHCIELAQGLVRKRIAKYVGGTWVLPLDVDRSELPDRLDQLVAERLAALGCVARDLAETLSVDGAPVSIERCLTLAGGAQPAEVYRALDELVAEQILLVENDSYRFAQRAVREAVLVQMDETRRRARHLQVAQEMLAANPKHGRRVAAALHLLRSGEEGRGADIIAQAGGAYLRESGVYDSSEQVVRALIKALEIYDKQGRDKREVMTVLYPLITLGYFVDFRVIQGHSMRGLSIGLEVTGLARAHALSRVIGERAALVLALGGAALKFRKLQRRGLAFSLKDAIRALCAMVPGTVGTSAVFFDLPAVERIQSMLEPMAMLGKPDQVPKLLYRFVQIQPLIIQGRLPEAGRALRELAPCFMTPKMIAEIGEGQCRGMYGGVIYCAAITHCFDFGRRALELAQEMDELGIHTWTASAEQVRLLYHAGRGESEEMARCRARVELFAVQGESTWQMEIFLPALLLDANLLAGDVVAARRNAEQLERRAQQVASLVPYAQLARAGYLSLRGDLPAAIAAFDETLPRFPPRSYPTWLLMRGHFAAALNRAGQHARAKQLLLDALAYGDTAPAHGGGASFTKPDDEASVWHSLEPRRQLALAEAGLGEPGRAASQLDALLEQYGQQDNPLLVGLLHKARAEVALQMHDEPALHAHFARMEQCFRATRNPALIAQVEQLVARARLSRPGVRDAALHAREPDSVSILRSFAELTAAPDRYRHALQLVLQRTGARAGFLYLLHGRSVRLVAASDASEPPLALETELLDSALHLQSGEQDQDDADDTRMLKHEPPSQHALVHRLIMLTTHRERKTTCVGGLILQDSENPCPDATFLESIAEALYDREGQSLAR